jgi:hypothetical protein
VYSHRIAWSVGAVLLFAVVAFTMNQRGLGGRVYARSRTTHVIEAPEQAPLIWQEKRVRGRTLVLFDDYPVALLASGPSEASPPPPSNIVGYAIHHGLIRRVYLVVPEARWKELGGSESRYLPLREVPGTPGALYLFTFSGVPMIAVTRSSLPHIQEEALVYVNGLLFDLPETLALLARKRITSDVLVSFQGGTRE